MLPAPLSNSYPRTARGRADLLCYSAWHTLNHIMKRVHNARHMTEAHLIRGLLESHGIDALVRGDLLTGGWGELPVDVCAVWITDDARFADADRLLQDFHKGALARIHAGNAWSCPQCNEAIEGQFTACWQCGAAQP
jgi:Putative prokaryotic signal transducing protein